jgi:glycosyltransferase involved in cell wall biosynthesis
MERPDCAVVIPARDEEASLRVLIPELVPVLEGLDRSWEVVIVDDGSTDGTAGVLRELAGAHRRIRPVSLTTGHGKAAALAAGFAATTAPAVVTLDADLQDDPRDVPRFLEAIDRGFDLACGWRRPRRDPWVRRASSRIFNAVLSLLLGPRLHDHNCGFKAYRRAVLDELSLYGDLHRFATFLAHTRGFRVTEVPVNHRPRRFGTSRYGVERIWRSLLDLATVHLLARRSRGVFDLFAAAGAPLSLAGLLLCLLMLPAAHAPAFDRIPLFLSGILAFLVGIQILAAGLLCELVLSIWRSRLPRRAQEPDLVSVILTGGTDALADADRRALDGVKHEIVDPGGEACGPHTATVRGSRFILLAPGAAGDCAALLAAPAAAGALCIGPSGRSGGGSAEILKRFPGTPRSLAELAVWCAGAGRRLEGIDPERGPRGLRAGLRAKIRYLPVFFLARYHARPLHFFGSAGAVLAATALAGGLAVKLSMLGGQLRYALMELALGLAVAGVQLFVAGLLGELLAYVASTVPRTDDAGPG